MGHFITITRQEFEGFLSKHYWVRPFKNDEYAFDWIFDRRKGEYRYRPGEIGEYCYLMLLHPKVGIKIYSSISRARDVSRPYAHDAIRLVAVRLDSRLSPIRPPFPHVKRVAGWKKNFQARADNIIKSLGANLQCPRCGSRLTLRKAPEIGVHFLGCQKFPNCRGSRSLNIEKFVLEYPHK